MSFQLKNYKSYVDSGELVFGTGINVVVGPNNVGKSALIETLVTRFGDHPHRSLATKASSQDVINPTSSKLFSVELSGTELRTILFQTGQQFGVPTRRGEPASDAFGRAVLNELLAKPSITIHLRYVPSGQVVSRIPSFGDYDSEQQALYSPLPDRSDFRWDGPQGLNPGNELGTHVGNAYLANSYTFRPERYNIAECPFGVSSVLLPDARNLPEVLNFLQGNNPARFTRYSELVRQIFPTVQRVTVRPNAANTTLQISVWTNHPDLERDDLAIPLNECGTGIGQVLAILYVTISSPVPRTIVIDEPNAFLHPGEVVPQIQTAR